MQIASDTVQPSQIDDTVPPMQTDDTVPPMQTDDTVPPMQIGDAVQPIRERKPDALLQRYFQLRNVLVGEPISDEAVEGLISKIEAATPPSFNEDTIWGDWQLCWQKNAKESTKSQKALTGRPAMANFQMAEYGTKIFRNDVELGSRVRVIADVAYTPPAAESGTPNRLGSRICKAGIEVKLGRRFGWKPLWVPLPLRGEGYLDVVYLSPYMRITRGNRGGVFVHLRPELLTREAAESTR
jgi:hypothetical protein